MALGASAADGVKNGPTLAKQRKKGWPVRQRQHDNLIADIMVAVMVTVRCRSILSLFQFTWPWGTVVSSVYPYQGGAYDGHALHGDRRG